MPIVRGTFNGSGASAVRISLDVNQVSATATSVTVNYFLIIERISGTGFFNDGTVSPINSYSINPDINDVNPGSNLTNTTGSGFAYDLRTNSNPGGYPYQYTIRSVNRTFTSMTGPITISFRATATDNASGIGTATTATGTLTLTPSGPPPESFTNIPYVSGTVGSTYNDVVISVGATNITRSGALPAGLTGVYESATQGYRVTGTPTTAGTSSFTLTATNGGGSTTYSASITINNPVSPPPAPPAPTNFVSGTITTTSIATSWSASSGATGYRLFLNGSQVAQISNANLTYLFSGLTPNTSYVLGIRAYSTNSGGTTTSSLVTITRSTLPVTFTTPNVITQLRDTAIGNLRSAGFATNVNVTNVTAAASAQNNRAVLSQTPTAGTTATVGDTASIGVYDFRVAMPSILGLTQTAANTSLTNAGLPLRTSSLVTSGATLANNLTVASQTPSSGTQFNIAETVTYTIFNFLIPVPNVVNLERTQGIINLNNAGFTSVNINLDIANATAQNVGTIKSQNPINSATTFNPQTTTVTLTVYSFGIAGKRSTGTGFSQINTARRFDGSIWRDLTVQRRFDGSVWRDIIN
jgi:beta-lactam-binding protein with PASTA domain